MCIRDRNISMIDAVNRTFASILSFNRRCNRETIAAVLWFIHDVFYELCLVSSPTGGGGGWVSFRSPCALSSSEITLILSNAFALRSFEISRNSSYTLAVRSFEITRSSSYNFALRSFEIARNSSDQFALRSFEITRNSSDQFALRPFEITRNSGDQFD